MRRGVTIVLCVQLHRIVHVLNHYPIYGDARHSGKKTFRYAVNRIDTVDIAPLSHDVPMTNDDATGVAVRFRQRSQHATKCFHLGREISRHSSGLRPGIGHCLIEQGAVHAGLFRFAALPPVAGRGIIN